MIHSLVSFHFSTTKATLPDESEYKQDLLSIADR